MKKLLLILLVLFSFTVNAQQRQRTSQKCISTTVVIKQKVTVTTIDKCKNTKVIKTYTKKEWEKLVAQRREKARKKRGGK
mgnify:CR=1 FL=1